MYLSRLYHMTLCDWFTGYQTVGYNVCSYQLHRLHMTSALQSILITHAIINGYFHIYLGDILYNKNISRNCVPCEGKQTNPINLKCVFISAAFIKLSIQYTDEASWSNVDLVFALLCHCYWITLWILTISRIYLLLHYCVVRYFTAV